MIKIIMTILLLASVSFAQSKETAKADKATAKKTKVEHNIQDINLANNTEMSRVKDQTSDCDSCNHSSLLANNPACLVNGICPEGYSPIPGKDNDGVQQGDRHLLVLQSIKKASVKAGFFFSH